MTSYFDELMKMWNKTTDDHIEWLKKRETMPIPELLDYARRLAHDSDTFNETTAHMIDENAGNHASLLAAKFKNQYAINRFFASVLLELCAKIVGLPRKSEKRDKSEISLDMKKAIAEEVKKAISEYKKESFRKLEVRKPRIK